jgi:SAM-dependent methyltransferase
MGIALNLIPIIKDAVAAHKLGGALVMLGRQTIEDGQSPEAFFHGLGFSRVNSLDVVGNEGADVLFDLNRSETPLELTDRWDTIFDGGSLEHVFHLPNALAHCTRILRSNGAFVHIGPMNNYVDHGFYQFSPTFWFDWFGANGWRVVESSMVRLGAEWSYSLLDRGRLGRVGQIEDAAPYMHFLVAIKDPGASYDRIPTQDHYVKLHKLTQRDGMALRKFSAYAVSGGRRIIDG